jgi:succinyl-diaminopimelate desuccinylase
MTTDAVALTRKLIAFDTHNPPGNERECARFLGGLLEDAGFTTGYYEFAEKRATLIARLNSRGEKLPILFTGHLDTVPLGTTIWSKDPFAGEIAGDQLFGRGASDMKSGVAAMTLMALEIARRSNRQAGLTIIFTAGEETTCEGARYIAGLAGVLGRAGAIVAGEPTGNQPWIAHKGCVRYAIRTKGVSAHASMPDQGVNAIYKAAAVIKKLEAFDFDLPRHPFLGDPTLAVTTMSAGTAINIIPEQAEFRVDIRTLPAQSEESVERRLKAALGDDVELRKLNSAPSVGSDAGDEWIQDVFGITERLTGRRPVPGGAVYTTDCSILTPAYGNPPTIILGPGEPEMMHKTDEFCYVSKIEYAAEVYGEIARLWCGT